MFATRLAFRSKNPNSTEAANHADFSFSVIFSQDLFVRLGIFQNLPSGFEADAFRNTVMSNKRETNHFILLTLNTGCFNLLINY